MTLKDLSKALGVSPSTISRVLSGQTKNFTIPDALRQRILDYVRESGYQPNPVFQALKKDKVRQIAILFYSRSSSGTGYSVEIMVDRAIRFFDEHQYDTSFTFNRSSRTPVKYALPPWKCAGLLIPDVRDPEQLSMIESSGIPYVSMNGIAGPNGTAVVMDEADSMSRILTYLERLGHRKIAYLVRRPEGDATPMSFDIGSMRQTAFRREMAARKLEGMIVYARQVVGDCVFVGADFEHLDGTPTYCFESPDFMATLLQCGVTAIVSDDNFAMEILYWANKGGIRIPDELGMICYNDLPYLRRTVPAVTTFRVPVEEMGTLAAQILYEKIEGNPDYKRGETITLQGNLVYRESTAPPHHNEFV